MLEDDPLWYRDAIIYELHVRAFSDSVGDGVGDFRGLTEKLEYLEDLGVTVIWLFPFIRHHCAMTAMTSPTTRAFTRATGSSPIFKRSCRRLIVVAFGSLPNWSSITRRISIRGFSAPGELPPARQSVTFTCGAIRRKSIPRPASSFRILSPRTGLGTRSPMRISGIAFTHISPI